METPNVLLKKGGWEVEVRDSSAGNKKCISFGREFKATIQLTEIIMHQ